MDWITLRKFAREFSKVVVGGVMAQAQNQSSQRLPADKRPKRWRTHTTRTNGVTNEGRDAMNVEQL